MKKSITVLISMLFGLTAAWASQPGQPLVWEDWTTALPGLVAESFATREDPECIGDGNPVKKCTYYDQQVGADGSFYWQNGTTIACAPFRSTCSGHEIWRTTSSGAIERVAYIDERGVNNDRIDRLMIVGISVDPTNGYLYVKVNSTSVGFDQSPPLYDSRFEIVRFRGLTTLFEILETYTPTANAVQFRVPSIPEGFRSADHLDTYWGNVSELPDFTAAHPMQCSYPKSAPAAGDYLTVADTSPRPSPGHANYIVTAVSYQGQRRYGRKRIGGALSGRDPASLPPCQNELP